MAEAIGPGKAANTPIGDARAPGSPKSSPPNLWQAGLAAAETVVRQDTGPGYVPVQGNASPTVPMAPERTPLRYLPPDEGVLKNDNPGPGFAGNYEGYVPKARLGPVAGNHVAVRYAGAAAVGPATVQGAFVLGSGALSLESMSAPDRDGVRRYLRVGVASDVRGSQDFRGMSIQGIGVGGRIETGYAFQLSGSQMNLGFYTNAMTSGTEGGAMLSIQTGR